jgi:hypothetical protein
MNEIEAFLEECANDPYFRVHPEKLNVLLATITEFFRANEGGALLTLDRVRQIATQTERTPRQRCKELFPLLLRALKNEDRGRHDKLDARDTQDSVEFDYARNSELSAATRSLVEALWILQGRVKALELLVVETVRTAARSHVDSELYVKQFVERAQLQSMLSISEEEERTVRECEMAFEEFLAAVNEGTEPALFEHA